MILRDEHHVLPPRLRLALTQVSGGLGLGKVPQPALDALISGLRDLPIVEFDRAAREIQLFGRLYRQREIDGRELRGCGLALLRFLPRPPGDRALLERTPGLAPLFLFHGDGHLREAALKRLSGPIDSPFLLVALVYRLNDLVPQIRAAAAAALERWAPAAPAAAIARALLFLLPRTGNWGRWRDRSDAFEALLARPDVAELLAAAIGERPAGPMAQILRNALQRPAMDAHLLRLMREARQPAVRALALAVLAEQRVRFRFGPRVEKKWIDKSMGRFVNVRAERERFVPRPLPVEDLVEIGVRDKAAPVRRAAVAALAGNRDSIPGWRALAERLAEDRSRGVRERAAYLLR